jgi:serine protease Do
VLDQIDGQPLDDSRAFLRAIVVLPPGETVHLTTWRNGQKHEISATVTAWPDYNPSAMTSEAVTKMMATAPDVGVKLARLNDVNRKQYGLSPELSGVLIAHVDPDSEASDLGIKEGDVVTRIQGAPVMTPDDVRRAVRDAQERHREYLAVLIRSKNGPQWIPISISGRGR